MAGGGVLLPEDVFFEIFMCLPVKSLLRFKSVSKSWYALIKSSDFIYRHAANTMDKSKLGTFIFQNHASNQFRVLSGDESLEVLHDLGTQPCFPNHGPPQGNNMLVRTKKIHMLASCNGIICLYDKKARDIGLWNPATKQCRILPKPLSSATVHKDAVGFGLDVVNKDYKVVLVRSFLKKGAMCPINCPRKVQIYSLSSDSWRWLDIDHLPTHCPRHKKGLYLNGNYFMIGLDYRSGKYGILSFDFTKEMFRKFLGPDGGDRPQSRLSLIYSIGDGKLACTKNTCDHRPFISYEVFALNDYSTEEESWTKLYSIRSPGGPFGPFALTRNGEFGFIMSPDGVMRLYNFTTDEMEDRCFGDVRTVDLSLTATEMEDLPFSDVRTVDLYKESFVSIKANGK